MTRRMGRWIVVMALASSSLACAGTCGGRRDSTCAVEGFEAPPPAWQAVCDEMDAVRQPREVSVTVGDADGVILTYTRGGVTPQTRHEIASASKWMAAAVLMRLVERGELSLEDHPQRYIDWWTDEAGDPRSRVTLAQLLAFTSGFGGSPSEVQCVNRERLTFEECARELYDEFYIYDTPGATYHYGPAHLHIAALMAEGATGKDWNTLFVEELVEPLGLGEQTRFVIAGPDHPRIAGGIESNAEDYATFLRAQLDGSYLSDSLDLMATDHTPAGEVELAVSPIEPAGQQWHYGFGLWLECPESSWQPRCDTLDRISSPGAWGFYPWLDRRQGYWGVISTRGGLLSGMSVKSVEAGQRLQPLIEAALAQGR